MATKSLHKALLGLVISVAATPVLAGGLERGGYNIDLLFDPSDYALEGTATFVMPHRKVKGAVDNPLKSPTPNPGAMPPVPAVPLPAAWSKTADDAESYWSPRLGGKAQIGDYGDCMFDYSEPWGAHLKPGTWQGSSYNIETKVKSENYAATCRVKFEAGKGTLSVIGGVFYQEISGYKFRQVLAPGLYNPAVHNGIGLLRMEGDGWGWRAGLAYEIPEIAFRTSLVYNSAVKHDLTGEVDLTSTATTGLGGNPYLGKVTPVYGSISMPDSLEFKIQSGIAPNWLAFGSVKWTDWSQLQTVPFCPVGSPICAAGTVSAINTLDLFYRDGWTVSAGIGHKFSEKWSGAASITWDRGTSTVIGTQTDSWVLGAQAIYSPNKNLEWKLSGALGILTSGSSSISGAACGPSVCGNEAGYRFDNDLVAAISTSVKVKF